MQALRLILSNIYVHKGLVLALFYIVTNAFSFPFSGFDYVIVYYMLIMAEISPENALGYGILFGISYDLHYHVFLGVGVLLFLSINLLKLHMWQMINMSKMYTYVLFMAGTLLLYILLTTLFLGYTKIYYWQAVLHYFLYNFAAFLVLYIIVGGVRAFRNA